MKTLNKFQGHLKRGVANLAWSPSGNILAASGKDDNHTIVVYDVTNKVTNGG